MIYIDRNRVNGQGERIRPGDQWFEDARQASAQLGPTSKFTDLYRHAEVLRALRSLFHNKCAFCEKQLDELQVEHYRPKSKVTGRNHGYYWLAYEWTNLYASCGACNTVMRHPGTQEDPEGEETSGKGVHFPLVEENRRASGPGCALDEEEPLLLDPNRPECANRFYFEPNGRVTALDPSDQAAKLTIEILGLDRFGLRELRHRHFRHFNGNVPEVTDEFAFAAFSRQMRTDLEDAAQAI